MSRKSSTWSMSIRIMSSLSRTKAKICSERRLTSTGEVNPTLYVFTEEC